MTAKLDLDNSNNTATLTFVGPSDRWFALQFGDFSVGGGMGNGEDVVYYNGSTLVDAVHNGIGIAPSNDANHWNLISNTTSSGTRTIIATRPFNTGDNNDYVFNFNDSTIDFAFSRSSSISFSLAYHGFSNRGYAINNSFTTLGIDDHEFKPNSIKLIPNPAVTNFYIHTSSKQDIVKVTIFNALGQEVLSVENSFYESIDVSSLPAGNYYVEIKSNTDKVTIKKLLKK
jgi:hypothetical protein